MNIFFLKILSVSYLKWYFSSTYPRVMLHHYILEAHRSSSKESGEFSLGTSYLVS